jgi:hypothetical protein
MSSSSMQKVSKVRQTPRHVRATQLEQAAFPFHKQVQHTCIGRVNVVVEGVMLRQVETKVGGRLRLKLR